MAVFAIVNSRTKHARHGSNFTTLTDFF